MIRLARFYSISSYKYMERYFEEIAAKGSMITKITPFFFAFEKFEADEYDFKVITTVAKSMFNLKNNEGDNAVRDLCEASGWNFVTRSGIYSIYYKKKSTEALPIHTDEELEHKLLWKNYWRTDGFKFFYLLFFALYYSNMASGSSITIMGGESWLFYTTIAITAQLTLVFKSLPQMVGILIQWFNYKRGVSKCLDNYQRVSKISIFSTTLNLVLLTLVIVFALYILNLSGLVYALIVFGGITCLAYYIRDLSTKETSNLYTTISIIFFLIYAFSILMILGSNKSYNQFASVSLEDNSYFNVEYNEINITSNFDHSYSNVLWSKCSYDEYETDKNRYYFFYFEPRYQWILEKALPEFVSDRRMRKFVEGNLTFYIGEGSVKDKYAYHIVFVEDYKISSFLIGYEDEEDLGDDLLHYISYFQE